MRARKYLIGQSCLPNPHYLEDLSEVQQMISSALLLRLPLGA